VGSYVPSVRKTKWYNPISKISADQRTVASSTKVTPYTESREI